MGKRKGIIYEVIKRLDARMAIGESRRDAKIAARKQVKESTGKRAWNVSTGKIYSHNTRKAYQEHILHFVNWCRDVHGIRDPDRLDACAEEMVSAYLLYRIELKHSPYTLLAVRSALRFYFADGRLAEAVVLPKRRREDIKRSRRPTKQDAEFQPANWPELIAFLKAAGLRREEITALFTFEICVDTKSARHVVYVRNGKGGQARVVTVLPGLEETVLAVKAQRPEDEHAFPRVPKNLDIHSLRREYSQAFYSAISGRALPPRNGRLKPAEYDRAAAELTSEQLGHHRLDVITTYYLR